MPVTLFAHHYSSVQIRVMDLRLINIDLLLSRKERSKKHLAMRRFWAIKIDAGYAISSRRPKRPIIQAGVLRLIKIC